MQQFLHFHQQQGKLMEMFLTLLSGICWSIVYIELIRQGFKDKTYAMPLFALGLNFAWEVIYFSNGFLFGAMGEVQTWVNLVWAVLDIVIIYTFFKYGREYFPKKAKKYFVPFSILVFATCLCFSSRSIYILSMCLQAPRVIPPLLKTLLCLLCS